MCEAPGGLSSRTETTCAFRSVLEGVDLWIHEYDPDGRCTYTNGRVRDLLGHEPEDMIGRSVTDLFILIPSGVAMVLPRAPEAHEQNFRRYRVYGLHRDGRKVPLGIRPNPVFANGVLRGHTCVAWPLEEVEVGPPAEGGSSQAAAPPDTALPESEHFLRQVIDLVPHFIFAKDADSRFLLVNQAVADAYGTTVDQIVGRSDIDFSATPEEAEHFHRDDLEVIRKGDMKLIPEERITDREGRIRWLETVKIPFRFGNSGIQGILGVSTNITARKQAEEKNRELNASLERRVIERTAQLSAAVRELEAFAYSVSHDLRGPLRALDGFSRAFIEDYGDKLDPGGIDYLDRISAASRRMAQLIDHLLNLSRVTRGEMQCKRVDLSEMAREIARDLHATAPERRIDWVIPSSLTLKADPALMRLVLSNLLDNSFKFTSKHATARIELGWESSRGRRIYFVRDDGAGFDMAYESKLFRAFERLHRSDEFEGIGIGLAMVQRIIDRHGGTVWARSMVEKGATVYFRIPAQRRNRESRPHLAGRGRPERRRSDASRAGEARS